MKIKLERTLTSCPDKLRCTICSQIFDIKRIRALLYGDRSLLQGDVCPQCLRLNADAIKLKIRERAEVLLSQPVSSISRLPYPQNTGLELLELSKEDIKFPGIFDWLTKKIEIFAKESNELEAARLGLTNCRCGKRSNLRIRFEEDELN